MTATNDQILAAVNAVWAKYDQLIAVSKAQKEAMVGILAQITAIRASLESGFAESKRDSNTQLHTLLQTQKLLIPPQ